MTETYDTDFFNEDDYDYTSVIGPNEYTVDGNTITVHEENIDNKYTYMKSGDYLVFLGPFLTTTTEGGWVKQ